MGNRDYYGEVPLVLASISHFNLSFMLHHARFHSPAAAIDFPALDFDLTVAFSPGVAYAMTIGEGASESDIRSLPRFKYCQDNSLGTFDNIKKPDEVGLTVESSCTNSTPELALHPEDSNLLEVFPRQLKICLTFDDLVKREQVISDWCCTCKGLENTGGSVGQV
ncbi:unnamed protein product [Ilex paraguariensis]|uniref:Uncharacterized protein n=1 Tax=Ilex paraguariensis TaxID=185542 RepID=A0ABC8RGZ8_9AQUA